MSSALILALGLLLNTQSASSNTLAPKSASAVAAQSVWQGWATQHKYRLCLSQDERLLLLVAEERGKPERALELVEQSLQRFDEMLTAPVRDEVSSGSDPSGLTSPVSDGSSKWVWGTPDHPLDSDTIVLGIFRKPDDYSAALTFIGESFPYLASWIAKGKEDPGCILERPLFGACVENVPGMEEWNPDNEIVHRTAQLAMLRRFGHQPVWVALGVGWNVEFDVVKSIYCFPWRRSFVSAKEHGGWENDLKRMFAKRVKLPLTVAELTACKRGHFDVFEAATSWGMIRYLARNHPQGLPQLLEELRMLRDTLGREPDGDTLNWTMRADFEVPTVEQGRALERMAPDVLAQASNFFRLGDRYERSRSKKTR